MAARKRVAVIDLGTNTFHLLIVDLEEQGHFSKIYRERRFIKLGENGVETIGDAPYRRGLNTLLDYKETLLQHSVTQVKVFGTAALRTASNGPGFIREVKEKTDLDITLISGEEEARLIYLGVRQAVPFSKETSLIMDIGGGSVEFIIADENTVYRAQSFPIGVSVLRNNFHKQEPISATELAALQLHLDETLRPLRSTLKNFDIQNLIGASGTFDVLETMLVQERLSDLYAEVEVKNFTPLYLKFLSMDLEGRLKTEKLPADRADMIVVALILIDYVLRLGNIERITVSAFAMKEGMLSEMT